MRIGGRGGRALVAAGAGCLLALSSCGTPGHRADGKIGVVAGVNVWGDIAAQIGGNRAVVTSLVTDAGADPHEYESNVRDAGVLAQAKVVLENGLGYDDFLARMLSAGPGGKREVLTVSDIVGVHGSDANPHLWYDPRYVITAARAVEAALARAAPADAGAFRANLGVFLAGEQRVVDVIDQVRARYAGTAVAYTERVPGYLLAVAGLRLGSPASFAQSLEDGNDPSPADNAAFEKALTDHAVKVLIYNAQVTDAATKHLRDIAARSGVPVVAMSETLPAGEPDFQSWQADQAGALRAALGG